MSFSLAIIPKSWLKYGWKLSARQILHHNQTSRVKSSTTQFGYDWNWASIYHIFCHFRPECVSSIRFLTFGWKTLRNLLRWNSATAFSKPACSELRTRFWLKYFCWILKCFAIAEIIIFASAGGFSSTGGGLTNKLEKILILFFGQKSKNLKMSVSLAGPECKEMRFGFLIVSSLPKC